MPSVLFCDHKAKQQTLLTWPPLSPYVIPPLYPPTKVVRIREKYSPHSHDKHTESR